MSSEDRISRDELFMRIAHLFGLRSTCPRGRVGCVVVKHNRIIATGYNGAPSGQRHCLDVGCELVNDHCVRAIHAEQNVMAFSARNGIALDNAALYTTHAPCLDCSKLIVNVGFEAVYYHFDYEPNGLNLMNRVGLMVSWSPYGIAS